jgi:hypothetical protein
MQGRGHGLGAFRSKYSGYGKHFDAGGFNFPGQDEVQVAAVTLYPPVGYVAVLDGSTGNVLQADALAGLNAAVYPNTLELYKGFAYIAGATEYIGDGIEYELNRFPQVAAGEFDMLLARVHLKTMNWKYIRTIGGENFDYLSKSTMDRKGNWYVGGDVDSPFIDDFTKRGKTLDKENGNYFSLVAQVSKRTGDIKSFHNFGGDFEIGNLTFIQVIAIGKDGLYVVGSWADPK